MPELVADAADVRTTKFTMLAAARMPTALNTATKGLEFGSTAIHG